MKNYLFALLLLLMPVTASARLLAIRDSVSNGYNFWLYVPKQYKDYRADRTKKHTAKAEQTDSTASAKPASKKVPAGLPVVVFLHGRSLSGTDLNTVRKYGTIDAISRGRALNAIVIEGVTADEDLSAYETLINDIVEALKDVNNKKSAYDTAESNHNSGEKNNQDNVEELLKA